MSDHLSGYEDLVLQMAAPKVLQITLNRPEARNALNSNLLRELAEAFSAAAENKEIGAVVITGGESVFAAGADIKELASHTRESILEDSRPNYWATIRDFKKPLIAAVNGYCLGGGNELAMHADVIYAGDNALFGQPEINLGIIPGAGGTQRLLHAIGKSRTMELVLGGAMITADEAAKAGLVSKVVAHEVTIEHALKLATTVASKAPLALEAAKKAVLHAMEAPLSQSLAFERDCFTSLFATEDMKEGVAAFMEKRKPAFKGR